MGTEANCLPMCSRTQFSDRLLLSMNSLQSLGSHSKFEQKLRNICTVHHVFHWREKTEAILMPVAEEADASTVIEEIFSFNMDTNRSAESFDLLRLRNRSFISFWENGWGASSSRTFSSSFSCASTPDVSSSLMPGSSLKIGTGISSQWATGRRADWRSGYLRLPRFCLLIPVTPTAQK